MSAVDSLPQTYHGLRDHIDALDAAGLLYRIDHPVNKDTEMHPLVRWQYRGGIPDEGRNAGPRKPKGYVKLVSMTPDLAALRAKVSSRVPSRPI